MKKLCKREVYASEISQYLGVRWTREDFIITGPASAKSAVPGSVTFCDNGSIPNTPGVLVIAREGIDTGASAAIRVENPEMAFYLAVNEFFMDSEPPVIDKTADISPSARISRGVSIGRNTIIGPGVIVGANTFIGAGVVIRGNVSLGSSCVVKDNAVIGSEGYHFIDHGRSYLQKPCLGSIRICDRVSLGSSTSIEIPLFDETVIEANAKIDDLVNIGSNCSVGARARIAAGSILCHGVSLGESSSIGVGVVVRDDVRIGSGCTVGIGSVVLNDVDDKKRVAGNPAREI